MEKKPKKSSIQKIILKILAGKKAVAMEEVIKDTPPQKYAITRSMKNLVSDGLVEAFSSEHKQYFRLTVDGRQKLNSIILDNDASLVSTTWDGYWRIVLLDLPENRKSEREGLRYLLKKAGFVCVKNSVWISMYPFEHLFTNIKKDLGLSTELIILVTDKIDQDTEEAFLRLIQ
jgi:DNA-binding transcriptional regulator PaaX